MGVGVGGPAPRPPTCGPALTHGRADAVALGVDEAPDLGEVAVPLGDVLDGGGLHEQRVVRRQGPLDALLVVLHQRRRLAAHEGPHLLEGGDLGFLGHKGRGDGHAVTEHTRGRALRALQTRLGACASVHSPRGENALLIAQSCTPRPWEGRSQNTQLASDKAEIQAQARPPGNPGIFAMAQVVFTLTFIKLIFFP